MAAAYTTLFSYIILAILQVVWVKRLCKDNGTSINNIFDNKMMFILAVLTTVSTLFVSSYM